MTNGVFRQTEIGLDHSLSTSAPAREDRQGRGRLIGGRKSGSENAKGGRNGRKMPSDASGPDFRRPADREAHPEKFSPCNKN